MEGVLEIAFQIVIHNQRKQAKTAGEDIPASEHRGTAKQSLLHKGDGAQGESTAETLEKKRGELEERRKRRRDETVRTLLLFCHLYYTPIKVRQI